MDSLSRQVWEEVKDPPALGTTTENAEDQEDLPDRRQDKIQAQEQGGFHPTQCSPNLGGCGIGGEGVGLETY